MSSITIEAQKDFYDARWAAHSYAGNLKLVRAAAILDGLASLTLPTPPRMLEVGCGTGWLTAILGQFGPTTGIELSEAAVAQARTANAHCTFHALDLASQPIPDGPYDVVVSHEVLEHFDDQPTHIQAIAEAMKPGGHLILTTPNGWYQSDGGQLIERHVTAAQLRALLTPTFTICRVSSLILPHTYNRWAPFRRLLRDHHFGRHLFAIAKKPA